MADFRIETDDLSRDATRGLLRSHLAGMHADSPPGSVFALDLSGLQQPDVTVWTVWDGNDLAGIGALKELENDIGEIKSMRTRDDYLCRGVAALLLDHIIREARERNLKQLSLGTGSGLAFEPALALYRKRGFANGSAFSTYEKSDFNQFLHMGL